MTALLISVIVWGIVAFLAVDDHCRIHEKKALLFLVVVGVVLTSVGLWSVEISQFQNIPFHDWVLMGYFPIILLYLRLKLKLVKKQCEEGRVLSLMEMDLGEIPEEGLFRQFRIISVVMWIYAALVLIIHFWG